MHKLNIVMNTEYEIKELKNNNLEFIMTNCSRDFIISNVQAKKLDYDLLDRIMHSVPIDTERH